MKKFIATIILGLGLIFVVNTSQGLYLINTYTETEFVDTEVGPVPTENLFGFVVHGDDFYKDFTK